MDVGGRLYFTGFSLQITHRSIHGKLTEGLDDFAQLAARHRGHLGRELTQLLVQELHRKGYFDQAKNVARNLEEQDDVDDCFADVAIQQANQNEFAAAYRTIEQIKSDTYRDTARIGVANALRRAGKVPMAIKMLDLAGRAIGGVAESEDKPRNRMIRRLVNAYGALGNKGQVDRLVAGAQDESEKLERLAHALHGYTYRNGEDPNPWW